MGTARVLGFELPRNFDRPFAAPTIIQFWRRWHISFSTWFADYVLVPLGLTLGRIRLRALATKRGRAVRTGVTVGIVFLLSGLWHGASWNYILWGALMGVLMILAIVVANLWKRAKIRVSAPFRTLGRLAGVIFTFHLVCASLSVFRAPDLGHVRTMLQQLGADFNVSVFYELTHLGSTPAEAATIDLAILGSSIVLLQLAEWLSAIGFAVRAPAPIRLFAWSSLCVWVLLAAVQTHSPFIYFAF